MPSVKGKSQIRRALDDLTNAYSSSNHSISCLIYDSKKEYLKEHQLACLTEVCAHLDHFDTSRHDVEITDHEVDHVLLSVLESISKQRDTVEIETVMSEREDEIRMLCSALEMVLRASPEAVYTSYKAVGKRMLPQLLILLKKFRPQSLTNNNGCSSCSSENTNVSTLTSSIHGCLPFVQPLSMSRSNSMNSIASTNIPPSAFSVLKTPDIITFNIYKILLYFSRVTYVRKEVLGQVEDLLGSLVYGLDEEVPLSMLALQSNEQYSTVANQLAREMRSVQLRSLANLSHDKENKVSMMKYPTLISALIRSATRSEKEKEYVGIILMNLSAERLNQVDIVSGYNGELVNTLVKLTRANSSETVDYATMAIENLAFLKVNRIRLITHRDGNVLDALLDLIQDRTNVRSRTERVQRRATGALMNLACTETAQMMASHKSLLSVLSITASSDASSEVTSRSSSALLKIANEIIISMPQFSTLFSALVTASTSPHVDVITVIIRQKSVSTIYVNEISYKQPFILP